MTLWIYIEIASIVVNYIKRNVRLILNFDGSPFTLVYFYVLNQVLLKSYPLTLLLVLPPTGATAALRHGIVPLPTQNRM